MTNADRKFRPGDVVRLRERPPFWHELKNLRRRNSIPCLLGGVEPCIGAPDELVWRVVGIEFGNPDAYRRGKG